MIKYEIRVRLHEKLVLNKYVVCNFFIHICIYIFSGGGGKGEEKRETGRGRDE